MKNLIRKFTVPFVAFILLSWAMVGATSVNAKPKKPKSPYSVAEPATLALLSAGLASVGLYAWKKRKKR